MIQNAFTQWPWCPPAQSPQQVSLSLHEITGRDVSPADSKQVSPFIINTWDLLNGSHCCLVMRHRASNKTDNISYPWAWRELGEGAEPRTIHQADPGLTTSKRWSQTFTLTPMSGYALHTIRQHTATALVGNFLFKGHINKPPAWASYYLKNRKPFHYSV